jgi:hypothetical protein
MISSSRREDLAVPAVLQSKPVCMTWTSCVNIMRLAVGVSSGRQEESNRFFSP